MLISLNQQHVPACREIYKSSVYAVDDQAYSPMQKQVWANFHASDEFADFVLQGLCLGVTAADGHLLGFCTATMRGHIKSLFVHPNAQKKGYATLLLQEAIGKLQHNDRLTVDASKLSLPVFLRFGFTVIEEETVTREGVPFDRFKMIKITSS